MKKTLAVILSLVMLLCCVPFAANAADSPTSSLIEWNENHTIKSTNELQSNVNYTVKKGYTLTIASDVTVIVPLSCTLIVEEGAALRVYGKMVVQGQLRVEGLIERGGAEKISVDDTGSTMIAVRFPALADEGLTGRIEVSYGVSTTGDPYADLQEGFALKSVSDAGETVYVSLNEYVYVKAAIKEPDPAYDKFDDSLMKVYVNNIPQTYGQGVHSFKVVSAADISYSPWTADNDFLSTFNIYLPTGEGYTVYGREGEQSALGETVKLKYGQTFSFKVEIDPEYDMSAYEVYIYNGYGWTNLDPSQDLADIEPAKPDEYGYYTINQVKGEHTVYVVGVVANETLLMVGNILDMVKNVFEMIASFFAEILAFFGLAV